MDKKSSNVFHIKSVKLEQASKELGPVLGNIYAVYGLDICLTLLCWYIAKGCLLSKDLTADEKDDLIEKCKRSIDTSVSVIRAELQNGSEGTT